MEHDDRSLEQRKDGTPQKHENGTELYVPKEDTISLLDLVEVLAKHWKFIFFSTLFAAIGIVVYLLYSARMPDDDPRNPLPDVYTPRAEILLEAPSESGLSGGLSGDAALYAAIAGESRGGASTSELAKHLLIEEELIDKVVEKYNIINNYIDSEFPRTKARKEIKDNLETEYDDETGILKIEFTAIDKKYATDLLRTMITLLEERFKGITLKQIREKKDFLEIRLTETTKEFEKAQEALKEFQQKYGIYDFEAQRQLVENKILDAVNQIYQKELEMQGLLEYLPPDSAQVKRLQNDVNRLKQLINALSYGSDDLPELGLSQTELADLSMEYLDLKTDLELKRNTYSRFRTQFEQARIEELDTTKTFQVIHLPEIPEMRSGPSRGTIAIIMTMTIGFLTVLISFFMEYLYRVRQDPLAEEKWEEIKDYFRFRKKRKKR